MSDKLDLDAIEAMCAAAVTGEWETYRRWYIIRRFDNGIEYVATVHDGDTLQFLAQSRTLIPALVARVRELEGLLRRALDALDE